MRNRKALRPALESHHLGNSVAFSPDGRTLAAGSGDNGTAALWDVQSHHLVWPLRSGNGGPINSFAFSSRGRTLAIGSGTGTVQLWDIRNRTRLETLDGRTGSIFSVAFSRDGRFLAAGAFNGTTRVWTKGVLWPD